MKRPICVALAVAALGLDARAQAEVVESSDAGFVTRDVAVVETNLKETWLALISPADWWSSQHTWSADAANLRLTPQAGGCFCEKIPEIDEPGRFTLEGSVEHMRVIQAYPENALRMVGALGPLQSEPVTGVLTIALTEVDIPQGKGTRIVWEYNVGGSMRYEIPVISKAVDGVMSLQLAGLAAKLGKVVVAQDDPAQGDGAADTPVKIETEDTLKDGAAAAEEAKPEGLSVDEAFGDLSEREGSV
ncbi:MAG: SRPBCC family protein [Erythrobacter sp.]|uniref:SRPBCC family protein n=1 Tax=Erythrobacter sp. TaxID=1042 RepID=UPI002639D5EE|nr:SRPBCC family protein [Erythrobacter sp.]MDJ0978077.1 SRPBCC family protein [Erythrobacter sp.]